MDYRRKLLISSNAGCCVPSAEQFSAYVCVCVWFVKKIYRWTFSMWALNTVYFTTPMKIAHLNLFAFPTQPSDPMNRTKWCLLFACFAKFTYSKFLFEILFQKCAIKWSRINRLININSIKNFPKPSASHHNTQHHVLDLSPIKHKFVIYRWNLIGEKNCSIKIKCNCRHRFIGNN